MPAQLFEVSIRIIERQDNSCLLVYANNRYIVKAGDIRKDNDGCYIAIEKLTRYNLMG